MSFAPSVLRPRIALAAAVAGVALLGLGAGGRDFGRVEAPLPDPTEAGSFYGTWYYGNRDQSIALWIRPSERGPEIKLRMLNLSTAEGFETDWTGRSDYFHEGWPGRFALELTERSENELRGNWTWVLERGSTQRREQGRTTVFRAGDGRSLVVKFDDFEKVWQSAAEEEALRVPVAFFWSFRKGSNRLVQWEELPF